MGPVTGAEANCTGRLLPSCFCCCRPGWGLGAQAGED